MLFIVGPGRRIGRRPVGTSKATTRITIALKMATRSDAARKAVAALGYSAVKGMSISARAPGLKLNNEAELVAAAGKVSELGQKFSKSYDGSGFAAVNQYFPGSDKYKGEVSN